MRPSRVPSRGHPDNAQHVLQADEYEAAHLIAGGLVVTSNEMSLSCRFARALRIFRLPAQQTFASAACAAGTLSATSAFTERPGFHANPAHSSRRFVGSGAAPRLRSTK
jgi:hypothetical protein